MTDHSDLKGKAEAATPGPWDVQTSGADAKVFRPDRSYMVIGDAIYHPRYVADAAYIAAASPGVVLALITENETLAAVLAEVRDIAAQNVAENERLRAEKAEIQWQLDQAMVGHQNDLRVHGHLAEANQRIETLLAEHERVLAAMEEIAAGPDPKAHVEGDPDPTATYELEGDYGIDARYVYPAREVWYQRKAAQAIAIRKEPPGVAVAHEVYHGLDCRCQPEAIAATGTSHAD